jgi:hypothetical protein
MATTDIRTVPEPSVRRRTCHRVSSSGTRPSTPMSCPRDESRPFPSGGDRWPSPTTGVATAHWTILARIRAGHWGGVDREGMAPLPVARIRLLALQRVAPARLEGRARQLPHGGKGGRGLCRPSPRRAPRPDGLRRHGGDDGELGGHPCLRDGGSLQPRSGPCLPRRRGTGRSDVRRNPPRGCRLVCGECLREADGRPGPCFGIAGPGSTNLLTGLYDAKVDRAPVLALSGHVPSKVLGRGAFRTST